MEVVMVKIQVSVTTSLVGTRQHLLPLLYMYKYKSGDEAKMICISCLFSKIVVVEEPQRLQFTSCMLKLSSAVFYVVFFRK